MRKTLRILRNILIVILALILAVFIGWKICPDSAKMQLIKYLSTLDSVRKYIDDEFGDEYANNVQDTSFDDNDLHLNEEIRKKLHGYTNIALFGIDTRSDKADDFEDGARSDSIMVVSINNETSEARLVSVYRDTYLQFIDDDDYVHYAKCNGAYNKGGAREAIDMLNTNLDLNITDYVIVNFAGLANIIELFDGIDVDLTEEEVKYVNKYITDMSHETNLKGTLVEEAGPNHLDGIQGLAFCRIRYTPFTDEDGKVYGGDLGRTARQRFVLSQLVDKAKKMGAGELVKTARTILNMNTGDQTFVKTSLTTTEVLDLIPYAIDYNIAGTCGFPFALDYKIMNGGDCVIPATLEYNVELLHEYLFNEKEYEVSEEVADISYTIRKKSGIKKITLRDKQLEELGFEIETETESETETKTRAKTSTKKKKKE